LDNTNCRRVRGCVKKKRNKKSKKKGQTTVPATLGKNSRDCSTNGRKNAKGADPTVQIES